MFPIPSHSLKDVVKDMFDHLMDILLEISKNATAVQQAGDIFYELQDCLFRKLDDAKVKHASYAQCLFLYFQILVNNVCFFCLFVFYLGFTAHQVYFTHFEPSQSLGGAKMGDPRENPPGHPQAELGLSHV